MSPNRSVTLRAALIAAVMVPLAVSPGTADEPPKLPPPVQRSVDFAADIQPIFRKNCHSCHGSEQQEGGLRLDQKKRALAGGDSGAEIVPGKSAQSRLVRLVAGVDEDFGIMPPEGKGKALTAAEVGLIRAWIDQGASWPESAGGADAAREHWSFRPIVRADLPSVQNRAWPATPIDTFILARLEQQNIKPSPPAERNTLVRRLFLVLLGLPPSPDDVHEFLSDARPDATERLVDRLLASPHFGERWGRHWLDLARYADSDGYEKDKPRPFAWRYRDWVIASINADMPYDQFTIEQIAGDLLPEATLAQKTASGLHRNTLHNTEGGIDPEEDRVKKTIDRTNTLGTIWLGLTVGCTQCHSHKYDPLTQREYYSLLAFFNSLDESDLEAPTPEQAAALAQAKQTHADELERMQEALKQYEAEKLPAAQATWIESLGDLTAQSLADKKIPADVSASLQKPQDQRSAEDNERIAQHYRTLDAEWIKRDKAIKNHESRSPKLPDEAKYQSVSQRSEPRVTSVLLRGDFLSPGEVVQPGTFAVLPPLGARGAAADRLDLAHWLVDPANPLTARVAANRVWQQLFGRGLVLTSDDFGKQGERPSHPELLDWLASEYVQCGWSLKELIRTIVASRAYQQSSAPRHGLVDVDPENVLLARQSRRRVEAEIVRDLSLTASGHLAARIGGPSVRPPQPAEYASLTYANSAKWVESHGADRYRRGLYTFFQRTSPYPMLMTFDSPDSNECIVRRQSSNTPLQALALWNDPTFFEASRSLGRRILRDVPPAADPRETVRQRAIHSFELCLSRRPSDAELGDLVALFDAQIRLTLLDEASARQIAGPDPMPEGASAAELAAWIGVGRTVLNLDEFITRE